jgi:hypothetical protein
MGEAEFIGSLNPGFCSSTLPGLAVARVVGIQQGMKEGIKTVLTKPLDINLLIAIFNAYNNLSKSGR